MKQTADFQRIYKSAKRWHKNSFVLFYLGAKDSLVGYTASKKVGNAVERNFSKRRLRALFRENLNLLKSGKFILVAKRKILEENFAILKKDFMLSLKKVNALK